MMSADEIIEMIKLSPLDEQELGRIMGAATTKLMANAFVSGGLDMMNNASIWGAETSTGELRQVCGARRNGPAGHFGQPCEESWHHVMPHRDLSGEEWS